MKKRIENKTIIPGTKDSLYYFEWYPVSKQPILPKNHDYCDIMVVVECRSIYIKNISPIIWIGEYCIQDKFKLLEDFPFNSPSNEEKEYEYKITHWAYLPELPKTK